MLNHVLGEWRQLSGFCQHAHGLSVPLQIMTPVHNTTEGQATVSINKKETHIFTVYEANDKQNNRQAVDQMWFYWHIKSQS